MTEKWECERCGLCCKWVVHRFGGNEEAIRYYTAHENFVVVYSNELKMPVVLIKSRCKYLNEDNLCDIYEDRPSVCKNHNEDCCVFLHRLCGCKIS